MGKEHHGKRRNCSLGAISSFLTVFFFFKDLYCRHVKTRDCSGKDNCSFQQYFSHIAMPSVPIHTFPEICFTSNSQNILLSHLLLSNISIVEATVSKKRGMTLSQLLSDIHLTHYQTKKFHICPN